VPGINGILGKKIGMSQTYTEDGVLTPVTVIQAGPCCVVQVKTPERDGYGAVQLGFDEQRRRRATKPAMGHARKAGIEPQRFVREIRTEGDTGLETGQVVTLDVLQGVRHVDVVGTSKGKGFAGVMKRWGFSGLGASHGTSKVHRAPGSIGAASDPIKAVPKGKHMAGRMGNSRCTVRNLRVVRLDQERNLLLVRGAVPGANGTYVIVKPGARQRKGEAT